jgi:uracil DNA glycosylase
METKEIQKLDYETFKSKLGDWGPHFKPFIEGKEMWEIYQSLKEDAKKEVIVPDSKDTFRAFSTTRKGDIKVVFYLMDPYPRKYKNGAFQATGIAMDCTNSPDGKIQPSLEKWYDAIDDSFEKDDRKDLISPPPHKCVRTPNLEYLHEQGVMLLNTDLTCKLNKTKSHERLWEPFQKYFLEEVMRDKTGVIYVLCGDTSKRMEKYIYPVSNYIYKIEHPAAAAHKERDWDYEGIFKTINKILFANHGPSGPIYWNKDDWDFYKDPPF